MCIYQIEYIGVMDKKYEVDGDESVEFDSTLH